MVTYNAQIVGKSDKLNTTIALIIMNISIAAIRTISVKVEISLIDKK